MFDILPSTNVITSTTNSVSVSSIRTLSSAVIVSISWYIANGVTSIVSTPSNIV